MCQYSAEDGVPSNWHLVHLGSRAIGGAALVVVEATGVSPEGRISPGDTGVWSEKHVEAFRPIAEFIKSQGAVAGIQLAHAGRKASTEAPWRGGKLVEPGSGGWETLAPSALRFSDGYSLPREMAAEDIDSVVRQFAAAAKRSLEAGFNLIELHMAHGYLMHEFLSPFSNHRTDNYGLSFENRVRLPLRVTAAVREVWPERYPLFVRISATDWEPGGWDLPQSIEFSRLLKKYGVDLIDCSSGGNLTNAMIPAGPNYQVQFAAAIRKEAQIATGAVGFITDPGQAESIIANGEADVVFLARAMLRDPYWPIHAAKSLGVDVEWPKQYARAKG